MAIRYYYHTTTIYSGYFSIKLSSATVVIPYSTIIIVNISSRIIVVPYSATIIVKSGIYIYILTIVTIVCYYYYNNSDFLPFFPPEIEASTQKEGPVPELQIWKKS